MKTLVMCSGGLDSTGALLHAVRMRGASNVRAVGFRYGQPACDAELYAARVVAERLGVAWESMVISDALRGGIVERVLPSGVDVKGVNNANVPARNFVFLAIAAARAGYYWPDEAIAIVIGAHADDAASFPDCRESFLLLAGRAAEAALEGVVKEVHIEAPWLHARKADILCHFLADAEALEMLRQSVSCYAGTRCGTCGACVQRAEAFTSAGVSDECVHTFKMTGGDPSRLYR